VRRGRILLLALATLLATFGVAAAIVLATLDSLGARPSGALEERVLASPHYRDGEFVNETETRSLSGGLVEMLRRQFFGTEVRVPTRPIPVERRRGTDYDAAPASGLRTTWIGHSTVLVEIDGAHVLTDPIWSDRCSPAAFFGPRRFFDPPLPLDELPPIDAVLVSHDHYDHLDMATAKALAARGARFFVPLGIGAHLARWGIDGVTDLDWNEEARVTDALTVVATPARHYSGRSVWQNQALWSSWVIAGPRHRVFYSGDTGYGPHFAEIGRRYGPFDLGLLKIGASDPTWKEIHMDPDEAVQAAMDVRASVLQPVHWGTFNLAYHDWFEPADRAVARAAQDGVRIVVPRPGEWVEPAAPAPVARWWAAPAMAPTPYTAAQIRDAMPVGTVIVYRRAEAGAQTYLDRWTVTAADASSCTIADEIVDEAGALLSARGTQTSRWEDLRRHAEFPAATLETSDDAVEVPAGRFETWKYVVTEPGGTVTTYQFARELPGPPVWMQVRGNAGVAFEMALVSRTPR
jgi:L-ascorbate metabolism protein UlaG (beta-lactamase superfamily)